MRLDLDDVDNLIESTSVLNDKIEAPKMANMKPGEKVCFMRYNSISLEIISYDELQHKITGIKDRLNFKGVRKDDVLSDLQNLHARILSIGTVDNDGYIVSPIIAGLLESHEIYFQNDFGRLKMYPSKEAFLDHTGLNINYL